MRIRSRAADPSGWNCSPRPFGTTLIRSGATPLNRTTSAFVASVGQTTRATRRRNEVLQENRFVVHGRPRNPAVRSRARSSIRSWQEITVCEGGVIAARWPFDWSVIWNTTSLPRRRASASGADAYRAR